MERTMGMKECLKCIIWVYAKRVCNACFALVVGYLRTRLTNLIVEFEILPVVLHYTAKHIDRGRRTMLRWPKSYLSNMSKTLVNRCPIGKHGD
jgi:hypothetical protein